MNPIGAEPFRYYQKVRKWDRTVKYVPEWATADLGPDWYWTGAVVMRDGAELFEMRLDTGDDYAGE